MYIRNKMCGYETEMDWFWIDYCVIVPVSA